MLTQLASGLAFAAVGVVLLRVTKPGGWWDRGSPRVRAFNRVFNWWLIEWLLDNPPSPSAQAEDDALDIARVAMRVGAVFWIALGLFLVASSRN